jgi:hypothetical protein
MNPDRLNRWLALGANLGVLIGLILLVYEVRQNSDLMRAQISMERANTNMQILADFSNGGELIPIDVKLREQAEGFPIALGWSTILTEEEKRRYEFWMFVRLTENEIRSNMRRSIHRFYELGIDFSRSDNSFIAVMQEFARLEGLPDVNDDGTWQ